jgi:hypothetical protein
MSISWRQQGAPQQSLLYSASLLLSEVLLFAWIAVPALADWYGSIGAAAPNIATGQTWYIKGIQAGGYGTAEQAEWFRYLPLAIFALLILAASIGERARRLAGKPLPRLHPLVWVAWFALLLGGGHWISLFMTGSWALPNHHPV